jgi:outer membrane protein
MKQNFKTVITALALLVANAAAYAQDNASQAFSLKQAQDFAMENALSSKSYANGIEQAKTNVNEAVAFGLPQLGGSVDYLNYIELPTSVIDASSFNPLAPEGMLIPVQFGVPHNLTLGLNARQMLFDPTWIIGVQGAKMYVEKMRNLDKKNDQDLATTIEQAYYTVLVAERSKKLMEQNLASLEKTLFETTEYFKNGFAEESSVDQLSLLVSNLKTSIDKAARQAEITKNVLKLQMGYEMDKDIQLTDELESLWVLNNHEALVNAKFDYTKNINYYLADMEVTLNGYLLKIENAKYLPTAFAFINYQTQAMGKTFTMFDNGQRYFQSSMWGVSLKLSIWDSFAKASSVKRSKLNLQRIKDTKDFTVQQLKLESATARSNYISAFEQLRAEEANIKLAESIRNKTVTKFNEGLSNSTELTQTETQLLQTQGAYISSLFQLLNAKAELNKVLLPY